MAKGASSKQKITEVLLKVFPNAFINDKEIRIPALEDGETVEIKCVLTCAKTNIGSPIAASSFTPESGPELVEPSEEEKQAVEELLKELGLT